MIDRLDRDRGDVEVDPWTMSKFLRCVDGHATEWKFTLPTATVLLQNFGASQFSSAHRPLAHM